MASLFGVIGRALDRTDYEESGYYKLLLLLLISNVPKVKLDLWKTGAVVEKFCCYYLSVKLLLIDLFI